MKSLVNQHYENNMKDSFYKSEIVKIMEDSGITRNIDWESAFFIWHRPKSNIDKFDNLPKDFQ